jgi:hypothetical protein
LCWEAFVNTNRSPISVLIIIAIISMGAALYLCTRTQIAFWALGQILLSLSILQWFFLLQKFGHGREIKSEAINAIGGHVSSFFCMVPYNQWRSLNAEHHKNAPRAIPIGKKFFPPLNALIYSTKNYWNIKKLFGLFPDKKTRIHFIMSMLVMNFFFMLVMPNVTHFWKKFGIGYFLFLVMAERWLIKQEQSPVQGPVS